MKNRSVCQFDISISFLLSNFCNIRQKSKLWTIYNDSMYKKSQIFRKGGSLEILKLFVKTKLMEKRSSFIQILLFLKTGLTLFQATPSSLYNISGNAEPQLPAPLPCNTPVPTGATRTKLEEATQTWCTHQSE